MRDRLINLQITLRQKTNIDPLRGTGFATNPLFFPTPTTLVNGFDDNFVDISGPPPKPKPRKAKASKTSNFQSHVMENWETHSPVQATAFFPENEEKSNSAQKKPTFKSHAQIPTANLIDF